MHSVLHLLVWLCAPVANRHLVTATSPKEHKFEHNDPFGFNSLALMITDTIVFTASPGTTATWTTILEKWQHKFEGTDAQQIEGLLKHESLFENALISVKEISGSTNLEMRFAVQKSDFTTCTMSCVRHHAKRVVDYLTSPDATLSATFQDVKAGETEFDYIPKFDQHDQKFPYLEETDVDSDVRVKPDTKEQPVEALNIHYVLRKLPSEGLVMMYLLLHMYEFYQNGVEATMFRLTAFDDKTPAVTGAAIYAVPNSDKTELWMAACKRKFQRVLMLLPSLEFAATVKKSRRICKFGDPSALQLYVILEGQLDRTSNHKVWRDLQNERSKVYEEYMNATFESLYKALPMLQNIKSELHRLSFDSFKIDKNGNTNAVLTIIVDAKHLKRNGTLNPSFKMGSWIPPEVILTSTGDLLTKFEVQLKTTYRGDEYCWLDNTPPPTERPKGGGFVVYPLSMTILIPTLITTVNFAST
ncbi:hypothetical protein CRM22_006195 [Opisthorchis felineus]|uniref:Uncharacterized protein n=1 Tax=Opisthorchis felineus TaxID=147828 RepID=A0A4V3SEJ8_OPIFE|nr:hypothetical protein CRM22_006195 [Opisthorchis felineus]TGZ64785.1 hypothetical protein CRM22_006195 [Opisthorchis felineus]